MRKIIFWVSVIAAVFAVGWDIYVGIQNFFMVLSPYQKLVAYWKPTTLLIVSWIVMLNTKE